MAQRERKLIFGRYQTETREIILLEAGVTYATLDEALRGAKASGYVPYKHVIAKVVSRRGSRSRIMEVRPALLLTREKVTRSRTHSVDALVVEEFDKGGRSVDYGLHVYPTEFEYGKNIF